MLEAIRNGAVEQSVAAVKTTAGIQPKPSVVEQDVLKQSKQVSEAELDQAVEDINDAFSAMSVQRQFRVEKDLNAIVVKVVNTDTEEVIRQIPSEEAIKLARNVKEMVGLIFDSKT